MKTRSTVLALALVLIPFTAIAEDIGKPSFDLPKDAVGLSPLLSRVISVVPSCATPTPDCSENSSVVSLLYTLKGCKDSLGPVQNSVVVGDDGAVTLYMTAWNIHSSMSRDIFCFVAPTEEVKVSIPGQIGQESMVKVVDLGVPL